MNDQVVFLVLFPVCTWMWIVWVYLFLFLFQDFFMAVERPKHTILIIHVQQSCPGLWRIWVSKIVTSEIFSLCVCAFACVTCYHFVGQGKKTQFYIDFILVIIIRHFPLFWKEEKKGEKRASCFCCMYYYITIKHILIECAYLVEVRKKYFEEKSLFLFLM